MYHFKLQKRSCTEEQNIEEEEEIVCFSYLLLPFILCLLTIELILDNQEKDQNYQVGGKINSVISQVPLKFSTPPKETNQNQSENPVLWFKYVKYSIPLEAAELHQNYSRHNMKINEVLTQSVYMKEKS